MHLPMFLRLVVVFVTFACLESQESRLVKVAVVHRHGDRTPYAPWTDIDPINKTSDWPDGWGEMTMRGKKRMYSLGQFIGNRYASLYSQDKPDIRVRSSGSPRCVVSVLCLLAGAFPPKFGHYIYPGLKWQPIPFKINDSMLNDAHYCPAVGIERQKLRLSGEEFEFNQNHQELYDFVVEKSGRNQRDTFATYALYDRLMLADQNGVQKPDWATQEVMEKLKEVAIKDFYFNSRTLKQRRLRLGMLFEDIIQGFKKSDKKFLIYATHDVVISIILQLFPHHDMSLVDFGATIFFELHEDKKGDKLIKIFFMKDTTTEELEEKTFSTQHTNLNYSLDNFERDMKPLFIDNFKRECGIET